MRRLATLKLNAYWKIQLKTTEDSIDGYVLGIFQYAEIDDAGSGDAYPIAVVEIPVNGKVITVDPVCITFKNEVDKC